MSVGRHKQRTKWIVGTLITLMIAALGPCLYGAYTLYWRHRALQAIDRMGGEVYQDIRTPAWVGRFLGKHAERLLNGAGWISLEECAFDSQQMWVIECLMPSHILVLAGTQVTDAAITSIVDLRTLRVLSLSSTRITSAGFSVLRQLPNLEQLDVSHTVLDDGAIRSLCQMSSIKRLEIVYSEDHEGRTQLNEDLLQELAEIFAIEVRVLPLLDNHMSVVLRRNDAIAADWSDEDVVRRWGSLFPPRGNDGAALKITDAWVEFHLNSAAWVRRTRERLTSLGWFMKCFKESDDSQRATPV